MSVGLGMPSLCLRSASTPEVETKRQTKQSTPPSQIPLPVCGTNHILPTYNLFFQLRKVLLCRLLRGAGINAVIVVHQHMTHTYHILPLYFRLL